MYVSHISFPHESYSLSISTLSSSSSSRISSSSALVLQSLIESTNEDALCKTFFLFLFLFILLEYVTLLPRRPVTMFDTSDRLENECCLLIGLLTGGRRSISQLSSQPTMVRLEVRLDATLSVQFRDEVLSACLIFFFSLGNAAELQQKKITSKIRKSEPCLAQQNSKQPNLYPTKLMSEVIISPISKVWYVTNLFLYCSPGALTILGSFNRFAFGGAH